MHVSPEQYGRLEQPAARDAHGLPHDFPLRVAETIADASLVEHLLGRARADDREVRRLAIFTLGWVARHFGAVASGAATPSGGENGWPDGRPDEQTALAVAHDVAAALVDIAVEEQDHFLAMNALDPLSHLVPPVYLVGSRLPGLMRHRSWQRRHPALEAAHLCPAPEIEPVLLEVAAGSDPIARSDAAVQLRRCPGPAVTGVLVGLLVESDSDVRSAALSSLVERDVEQALPHVREAAATWPSPVRYSATALLTEHGDDQDVPLVAERVRRLIGRTRNLEMSPSELQHLLPFLARHRGDPAADKAFAYVTKRWSTLFDDEQRWLAATYPELVPRGAPAPPPPRPRIERTPRCPTDLDALAPAGRVGGRWWRRGSS